MPYKVIFIFMLVLVVSGCASNRDEFFKALEHDQYHQLALGFTQYCARVYEGGTLIERERIELVREIRQSHLGAFGPEAPSSFLASLTIPKDKNKGQGAEAKTRMGTGPIVMVYCRGDKVPDEVWQSLDRYWNE